MKRFFALVGFLLTVALATAQEQPAAPAAAAPQKLVVEFLDVGQGDSILIRTPDGKTALVDTGTPKNGAYPHLDKRNIKNIDLLVTSHHHTDHMGGSAEVFEECKVKAYLDSGSAYTSPTYRGVLQAMKNSPTKVQPIFPRKNTERKIKLGESVVIRVFPQPPEDEDNENNNSIGLRVEYKKFSVILTGDSEDDERAWWLKHADKSLYSKVSVLKLAHHGSHNGTDEAWLKATAPELAVVSSGHKYGHPHKKTLDLLKEHKIELKRTDSGGTVTIVSDGERFEVSQAAQAPRLFPGEPAAADARGWYTSPERPARVPAPAPAPRAAAPIRP